MANGVEKFGQRERMLSHREAAIKRLDRADFTWRILPSVTIEGSLLVYSLECCRRSRPDSRTGTIGITATEVAVEP